MALYSTDSFTNATNKATNGALARLLFNSVTCSLASLPSHHPYSPHFFPPFPDEKNHSGEMELSVSSRIPITMAQTQCGSARSLSRFISLLSDHIYVVLPFARSFLVS
jgi:hypothetical protein